jgi:hypothetical protein
MGIPRTACTQTWLFWTAAPAWGRTCLRQTQQVCEKASAGILPDTTSHLGSSATCRPCCHSAHTYMHEAGRSSPADNIHRCRCKSFCTLLNAPVKCTMSAHS